MYYQTVDIYIYIFPFLFTSYEKVPNNAYWIIDEHKKGQNISLKRYDGTLIIWKEEHIVAENDGTLKFWWKKSSLHLFTFKTPIFFYNNNINESYSIRITMFCSRRN